MASQSDIDAMKAWALKQPHLPQQGDERLLANFLFCCDNSLEVAKSLVELHFTFRGDCPEIFCNRDPLSPNIQHIFDIIEICALPDLTPEGYGVLIIRFADSDPDKFNFYDFVKAFFMVGDARARSETRLVKGLVPILDMTGWSLRHLAKANILSIRKYIQFCQDAQPVKLKSIHIVNATPLYDKLFAIVRPFVKSEITSVVNVHPVGSDTLLKCVPKDILPVEYGGSAGTMKDINEQCRKMVEADRDWFLTDEWIADESKRIGKRTSVRPEMDGSFRSLAVD